MGAGGVDALYSYIRTRREATRISESGDAMRFRGADVDPAVVQRQRAFLPPSVLDELCISAAGTVVGRY
jgi:hypothetical protein